MKLRDNPRILWSKRPEFCLVNDGYYQTVVCVVDGCVELGDSPLVVTFPVGWKTDVTSTPWFLHSLLSQLGPHSPAAILHDRLLDLGMHREIARYWMVMQLHQLPLVNPWRRRIMHAGVWFFDKILYRLPKSK